MTTRARTVMEFDRESTARLEKAYAAAKKADKGTFMFDGNEFVTAYAKYLIEYLNNTQLN